MNIKSPIGVHRRGDPRARVGAAVAFVLCSSSCWAADTPVPVRTITAFVNVVPTNAEAKLTEAAVFLKSARADMQKRGYTVQTIRVATEAAAAYTAELSGDEAIKFFVKLDAIAQKEGFALSIGPLDSSRARVNAEIFRQTAAINASMIIREPGSARAAAELIMELSRQIPDGSQNFRFAATAGLAPGSPFFPGGYAARELDHTFALGAESPALFRGNYDVAKELGAIAEAGEEIGKSGDWEYVGLDTSPAPAPGNSMAAAIEKIGGAPLGTPGTIAAAASITALIKGLPFRQTGYNGLMLPVLEDDVLADRVAEGRLSVYSLLLYSAVCGTGLDTIPIAGDVPVDRVAKLLGEVALLARRWNKPLTARLFPVPGKKAGDEVRWNHEHLVTHFKIMEMGR
jgi:uncharacterized protein (UPF0210 family)